MGGYHDKSFLGNLPHLDPSRLGTVTSSKLGQLALRCVCERADIFFNSPGAPATRIQMERSEAHQLACIS